MKLGTLALFYLLAVLSPLLLVWFTGAEPRTVRQELASGLGILAFSIILVEFILSGRFKRVSNGVGMDVTMRLHQLMARTALGFALLHPLLYPGSATGGPRPWDPDRQLTLTTDFAALSTGIAAYLILPSLVALAIGRRHLDYSYETWRLIHGVGALILALLLLHHTIYAGRYAARPEMTWFWLAMTGIAVGSLLYVYFIVPLRARRFPWQVTSVRQLTPKQWELTVAPDGHKGLAYEAGQFVWLNIGHSAFSLKENPFSISSAPASGAEVSFLIKELGDFTNTIGSIPLHTRAHLDGPYGNLSVEGQDVPGVALIAGGVGLAPLIGILRQMRLTDDPRKRRLIYGNRLEEQIAFREELEQEDTVHVLSEPPKHWDGETGMIDAHLLSRTFTADEIASWVFVLCGPKPMLDGVEGFLLSHGTPRHRILSERFNYD